MWLRKIFYLTILVISLLTISTKAISANEGQVDLKSTVSGRPNRCVVSSHRNITNQFTLLISCRDLSYTPTSEAIRYMVWTIPIGESDPLNAGLLDFGKGQYKVVDPFNTVFVTVETRTDVKEPEGQVIMRGNVRPYEFLDPTRPTPTQTDDEDLSEDIEITPTPTPKRGLSSTLRRSGVVISIILLGLLIGFIFVITRPRR
ncbi:hypothetical protein ACFL2C_01210 [Patescibacteria group bacterium]